MPRKHARALRALLWTFSALLVLWLTLIKLPMAITRLRFTHLLADFHTIQPNQSNWQDAQRLMIRWGKWGHYDGTCNATDCTYSILIPDPYTHWMSTSLSQNQRETLYESHLPQIGEALGWRFTFLSVQFDVQDGKIVRTDTRMYLGEFFIESHVHARLTDTGDKELFNDRWVPGEDAQLGDHPDYKLGRGHCEGCLEGVFSYTAKLSHDEVLQHTNLNFSCLTSIRSCTEMTDTWLIGPEWQKEGEIGGGDYNVPPKLPPTSCRANPRARGRDASLILEVETLAVDAQQDPRATASETIEIANVRLVSILKGSFIPTPGQSLMIAPFPGYNHFDPPESPEHLTPSQRSVIAFDGLVSVGNVLFLPRCGILADTPANLAEIQAGRSQDFSYRHPPAPPQWP